MESHFRHDERQLLEVMEALALDADPQHMLGRCERTARREDALSAGPRQGMRAIVCTDNGPTKGT